MAPRCRPRRIYRQLFGTALPDANASFLSNEDALLKLISDSGLDVVVVVAGQPAKLLVDMKPEARKLIKLLKFDPANPASTAAFKTYFPATIRASSYPNLLPADIPGAAVKAFLVTYDYKLGSVERLGKFARSLCQNFAKLQAEGHPKWREVQLALPDLPRGWAYYPPMWQEMKNCIARRPRPTPIHVCSQQERILAFASRNLPACRCKQRIASRAARLHSIYARSKRPCRLESTRAIRITSASLNVSRGPRYRTSIRRSHHGYAVNARTPDAIPRLASAACTHAAGNSRGSSST